MGTPEKLVSAHIVSMLGLWRVDAWNLDTRTIGDWSCKNWTLGLWSVKTKKMKLHFTVKSAVADYAIFNGVF